MIRFIADSMLGRLAKWLRIMGYDCDFVPHDERDRELMLLEAREEGAVLLTRDTELAARCGPSKTILFREQRWRNQLRRLIRELDLKPSEENFFTRCTLCNEKLVAAPREEALREAPPKTLEHDHPFFRCPNCRKLYWPGTHLDLVRDEINELIGKR